MKLSTTITMLVLVGGLVTFIATYERKLPSTRERIERQNRPFLFNPAEAAEITITTKDTTLTLTREGPAWQVQAPYADRANPELVAGLLSHLVALEWMDSIPRKDQSKDDYKRTGLGGSSALEVTVNGPAGTLARCRFGARAAYEESYYASLPGAPGGDSDKEMLHVAKTPLPPLLAKAPEEWRDSKLLRIPADQVSRFVLAAGTGSIEFTREKGRPWQLVKPLQTPASNDRVNAVLAAVLNMEVRLNPSASATPPADAKPANPALPVMTVALGVEGSPKPVNLTLQPVEPGQEVPVEASNRPGRFLAPAKLSDFWRLQPNHLRDQQLARIPVEHVTAVRLRSLAEPEVVLDKEGGFWMLQRFGKKEPGNQARIQELLDGLNSTQVRAFVSDNTLTNLEPYGLDKPFLEIEWRTPQATRVLQFGQARQGAISAKYREEPSIFQVSPLMLGIAPPETLKWRSGRVLSASLFAVRRVTVAPGTAPALTLHYDAPTATWTGELAGADITPRLDPAKANHLLNLLVNFDAAEWSTNRAAAFQALKNPALTVQLLLADLSQPDSPPQPITLTFAPATAAPGQPPTLYHGRVNEDPDTFLIDRATYEALTTSVIKAEGR